MEIKPVRLPKKSYVLLTASLALGCAVGFRLDHLNRKYKALHEGTRQILGRLSKTNAELAAKVSLDVDGLTKQLATERESSVALSAQLAAKIQEVTDLTNSVAEKQATILTLGKQLEASVNPEEAAAVAEAVKDLYDIRKNEELQLLETKLQEAQAQRDSLQSENKSLRERIELLEAQIAALEEDAAIASEKIKHLSSVVHICSRCSQPISSPTYGGSGGDCDCG